MAYLSTGLDLQTDALVLSGEPFDGTSEYDDDVYEWLTVIQRTLVSGGQVGAAALQPIDWYWARAWPRGAIQLVQPYNQAFTVPATFTAGSAGFSVPNANVLPDLSGYRVWRADVGARHLITRVQNISTSTNNAVLREPWTGPSDTTVEWMAYPDSYELPVDFVRGASPLYVQGAPSTWMGPWEINIIDPRDLERLYGATNWANFVQPSTPVAAARITEDRLRILPFLNSPADPDNVQVEFEYIKEPEVIAEGVIPAVPIHHRRVLSYGVAYLILLDKGDSDSQGLFQQFQSQYQAMKSEHLKEAQRMSSMYGRLGPARASHWTAIRFTESGLPVYVW